MRALVVDDEEVVRSVVLEVLEGMGLWRGLRNRWPTRARSHRRAVGPAHHRQEPSDGSGLTLVREVGEGSLDRVVVTEQRVRHAFVGGGSAAGGRRRLCGEPFDLADFRARLQRAVESLKLRRAYRNLFKELQEKNGILEGLARADPLTGLDNHASFQESVRKEIERGRRYGAPARWVLASIDRFLGH